MKPIYLKIIKTQLNFENILSSNFELKKNNNKGFNYLIYFKKYLMEQMSMVCVIFFSMCIGIKKILGLILSHCLFIKLFLLLYNINTHI